MFPLMFPRTHLSRHKPGTRPLHRQPLSYCHKPGARPLYSPLPCCHTPQRRCASLLTGSTPSSGCRAALTSAFSSHGLLFADFTIILTIIRYDNRQKLSCNPLRPI